jgi:alkylhydroperoxidase/carboxymuconolactone decarboxylase family protein YurZ
MRNVFQFGPSDSFPVIARRSRSNLYFFQKGANSRGAVMSQTRKALESGASKEEIAHVVLLSLTTIGFPNMIAAMGWVDEVLEGA